MQILLDLLRRYNYLFLFVLLEIVSLSLLVRYNSYPGSVWLTAANEASARLNALYAHGTSYFALRSLNRRISDENIRLQIENERLRDALARAPRDSSATEQQVHRILAGYRLIPATVVSNKVQRGTDNYLVVDRGALDGVRPEMGVIAGGGVVGIVYLTGPHHALVLPATHSKSSISCRVQGKHYFGYLQWNGNSTRRAYVDDIPRYAKARRGAVIETSGYSAVFPPGINVGRVERVANSADGQSYRLEVLLGNDFGNLRDVSIIATPYKAEIDTLLQKADSLETRH